MLDIKYEYYDYEKRKKLKKSSRSKSNNKRRDFDEESTPMLTTNHEGGAKSQKSKISKNQDSEGYADYMENRKFYCCFTAKCSIIFFGIVLLINTCFECYEVHLVF